MRNQKSFKVNGNKINIVEEVVRELTYDEVVREIQQLERDKERIKRQNDELVQRYADIEVEILELSNVLTQFNVVVTDVKTIE